MTFFAFPKTDRLGIAAFLLLVLAAPAYAVSSFEGTIETSVSRWLALYLLAIEVAIVIMALLSGWHPIISWKKLPAHVRIALTLWFVVASIATASSSDVGYSMIFQMFWIVHGVFAWALWAMLTTRWHGAINSLAVYFSIGILLHSFVVYIVAWFLFGLKLENWEPYSVGTTNPRLYIFYAAVLLGMGLGFLVAAKDKSAWILAVILTFAAYHLFAWSGGRASFGTSLIAPLLLALLAGKAWKRIMVVASTCATVAFPLSLLTAPAHPIYGFKSVLGRIATDAGGDAYSSGRLDIWTRMLAQSLDKPVFGHGQIGTLGLLQEMPAGAALNAHNAIVHIVHAWGGLGLLALAIGLLPFLSTIRLRLESRPTVAWPAFAALLTLAITSALDGTLFYNQPLFFGAVCIALLASVPASSKSASVLTKNLQNVGCLKGLSVH